MLTPSTNNRSTVLVSPLVAAWTKRSTFVSGAAVGDTGIGDGGIGDRGAGGCVAAAAARAVGDEGATVGVDGTVVRFTSGSEAPPEQAASNASAPHAMKAVPCFDRLSMRGFRLFILTNFRSP
jgi:hypothetical protein